MSLETRVGIGRFEEMLRWGVEGSKVIQGAMEEVSLTLSHAFRRYGKTVLMIDVCVYVE